MKCPICKTEMENGTLFGDRYTLKWLPASKKLFMGIWAKGAVRIDNRTKLQRFYKRPYINGNVCKECNKIILDLPESPQDVPK